MPVTPLEPIPEPSLVKDEMHAGDSSEHHEFAFASVPPAPRVPTCGSQALIFGAVVE